MPGCSVLGKFIIDILGIWKRDWMWMGVGQGTGNEGCAEGPKEDEFRHEKLKGESFG
jgi:hypothetical protein